MAVACIREPRYYDDNWFLVFAKFCAWTARSFNLGLTAEQLICLCQECVAVAEYYKHDSDFEMHFRFYVAELNNHISRFDEAVKHLKLILFKTAKNNKKREQINIFFMLGKTYMLSNQYQEAILQYKQGIELAEEIGKRETVMIWNLELGRTYQMLKQHQGSILHFEQCLKIAEEIDNREAERDSCLELGRIYLELKQFQNSIMYGKKSLQIAKEASNKNVELNAHSLLYNAYSSLNQYEDAILCLESCIGIVKETGDKRTEVNAYLALGNAYYKLEQFNKAVSYLTHCCEDAENIGENSVEMKAKLIMGNTFQKMDKYDDAISCGERAIKLAKEIGDKKYEMDSSFLLGQTFQIKKAYSKAVRYSKMCIDIAKGNGDEYTEMSGYLVAAMAYWSIGQYDDALECGLKCLEISLKLGEKIAKAKAYSLLAKTHADLNQFDNAAIYSKKCIEAAKEIGDKLSLINGYLVLGDVHRTLNENEDAIYFSLKAMGVAKETNDVRNEMNANILLGCVYKSKMHFDDAITHIEESIEIAMEINNQKTEMEGYFVLGEVYYSKCEYSNAILYCDKCISTAHHVNRAGDLLVMWARFYAAESHLSLNNYEQAISHSEKCIVLAKETSAIDFEMNAYLVLVKTYQSLKKYDTATFYSDKCFEIIKKTGDKYLEINTYYKSLYASYTLNKYDNVIQYGKRCIEIADLRGDKMIEMTAYLLLCNSYSEMKMYKEAVLYSNKCIVLAIKSNEKLHEMKAYLVLAGAHLSLGHLDYAIFYSKKCVDLALDTGEKSIEFMAYCVLSETHLNLQQYDYAVTCGGKCIDAAKSSGNKEYEAKACLLLGNTYHILRRYQDVIVYSERCLTILEETGDHPLEIIACLYAGKAYHSLAQYERALFFFEKGLINAKKIQNVIAINEFQFYIYSIRLSVGSPEETVPYGKDVLYGYFWRKMRAVNLRKKYAAKLLEKYNDYKLREEYELALNYLDKLIEQTEPGLALEVDKAEIYMRLNQNDLALEILQDKLSLCIRDGDKRIQAECNFLLGKVYQNLGQFKKAEESLRDSLQCFEYMFYHLGKYKEFKISIVDRYTRCFKELSTILIDNGQFEQALLISDNCRARVLKDVLLENMGMERISTDKRDLEFTDISSLVSSSKCAILFYSVCDTKLFPFILKDSGKVHCIPQNFKDCETLEAMAEKVFEEMDVRKADDSDNKPDIETTKSGVNNSVGNHETTPSSEQFLLHFDTVNVRSEESEENCMTSSLETMYGKLLHNVMSFVNQDEIVIIPDGPLSKVPFAALRNPDTGRYLSETKRIRLAPSIATLILLKEIPVEYTCKKGALIIGYPLVGKVMFDGKEKEFRPLHNAYCEALAVGKLLYATPLTKEKATKQAAIEKLQQGVSIVHIAAHGILSKSTIVLAPSPEIRATKIPDEEDYMLTMADVQKAQVHAKLVVLSCCYSGRGKIRAEGVVGMCRAFLASGARAVVASLWSINDEATWEFMMRFYQNMIERKLSASASLQQAMEEMRNTVRYNEPKYWAPFFLMGDDVTIKF